MKCRYCGKEFNPYAFKEYYCPYCGNVIDKDVQEKINDKRYFFDNTLPKILLSIFGFAFLLMAVLSWLI